MCQRETATKWRVECESGIGEGPSHSADGDNDSRQLQPCDDRTQDDSQVSTPESHHHYMQARSVVTESFQQQSQSFQHDSHAVNAESLYKKSPNHNSLAVSE